jgi:hypothetical protein
MRNLDDVRAAGRRGPLLMLRSKQLREPATLGAQVVYGWHPPAVFLSQGNLADADLQRVCDRRE